MHRQGLGLVDLGDLLHHLLDVRVDGVGGLLLVVVESADLDEHHVPLAAGGEQLDDVVLGDDSDELLALHDRQGGDVVLRHDVHGHRHVVVPVDGLHRRQGDGLDRDLGSGALLQVSDGLVVLLPVVVDDLPHPDDAHESVGIVDDGNRPVVLPDHQVESVVHQVVDLHGLHRVAHDLPDLDLLQGLDVPDDLDEPVPVDDPGDLLSGDDRELPAVRGHHHLGDLRDLHVDGHGRELLHEVLDLGVQGHALLPEDGCVTDHSHILAAVDDGDVLIFGFPHY